MPNRVIVNLSTDKYRRGQNRLIRSVRAHTTEPIITYKSEAEVGAQPHAQNMYSFKPYAMKAVDQDVVLWLDASMYVIRDLSPLFDKIEQDGYFFQDSGWANSRWTNRTAKEYFGTDEGEMISSGVLGIDFRSTIGRTFFDMWIKAADDGIFNGSHADHRHDQTAASLIAHKLGLTVTPNNTFWNYGKDPFHKDILILADGIV